ncbi:MAG: ATP-binding protein [Nitrospira sp. WS238]|nr:ATP-binding protein [Nitrospira sp. WS238]
MAILLSVASGKGGVGKSVVSANLALALAKTGRQVLLADLDVGGADAHIMLWELNPSVTLTDFLHKRVSHLEEVALPVTFHPNLRLIAGTGETLATANLAHARKKRLIKQFQGLHADVVVIDIGAGTNYHALDFFLMADIHLAVATPDPTAVLDLYRFIKLAAIRRVLACFLARSPMAEVLSNRDFSSVEEVLEVAGTTDIEGREIAMTALRSFRPGLIINRASSQSQVNVLYLRKILHEYVGGDLTLLGEIPDDPAVSQAIRKFLPVIEAAPESPAGKGLLAISAAVEQLVVSYRRTTEANEPQSDGRSLDVQDTYAEVTVPLLIPSPVKSEVPLPSHGARSSSSTETAQNMNEFLV